jgi:hypothetical protein
MIALSGCASSCPIEVVSADRLTAIGVGGEGQVPPAIELGATPCPVLIQEPSDQERLEKQRGNRG